MGDCGFYKITAMDNYQKLKLFHLGPIIKKNHTKKHLRCVVFGNFGSMNKGDDAILAAELSDIHTVPGVTAKVVARFPEEVKHLQPNVLSYYSPRKIIKEVKRADFVVVGGGGLICKVERGLIGFVYQLYMLFLFYMLPKFFKKKIYTEGIGVYSNTNPLILKVALHCLKFSTLITVRDQHSHDLLRKNDIVSTFCKDSTFLMSLRSAKSLLLDDYFKVNYRADKKNIGISLVNPESKKEEKKLIQELGAFIKKNYQTADFWFFATDYHKSYKNDVSLGKLLQEYIVKEIKGDVRFYFIPTQWDAEKFFSAFQLMDFFIGMRLHSLIFAYRSKIKFVGIVYDKKCASFLSSIGKESIEIRRISAEKLQKQFTSNTIL